MKLNQKINGIAIPKGKDIFVLSKGVSVRRLFYVIQKEIALQIWLAYKLENNVKEGYVSVNT